MTKPARNKKTESEFGPTVIEGIEFGEAKKRDFAHKLLPQSFGGTSDDDILSKYDQIGEKVCQRQKVTTDKARAKAIDLLRKEKIARALYSKLIESNVEPRPVLEAVLHVARGIEPGRPATEKVISQLIGECPDDVSKKYWREEIPKVLDFVGLTVKKSDTQRDFADLYDLQNKCNVLLKACHLVGVAGGKVVSAPVMACDSFIGKHLRANPYVEQAKNGVRVVHQKPDETPEGKAAKRDAEMAEFMAKQQARKARAESAKSGGENIESDWREILHEYKWWVICGCLLTVILVTLAQMKTFKYDTGPEVLITEPTVNFTDQVIEDMGQ